MTYEEDMRNRLRELVDRLRAEGREADAGLVAQTLVRYAKQPKPVTENFIYTVGGVFYTKSYHHPAPPFGLPLPTPMKGK